MLVWVDLETTGLDAARDEILECAIVVTDDELNEISHTVKVRSWNPLVMGKTLRESITDSFVLDMHTNNGLLADVDQQAQTVDLVTMDEFFLNFLRACEIERGQAPLCGSNVANFDRQFMRRAMPLTETYLHYRNIDLSSIKEAARRWAPSIEIPPKAEAHRALPDVRESIELARLFRFSLFGVAEDRHA